jgi:hypothetical protein
MSRSVQMELDTVLPELAAAHLHAGNPLKIRARGLSMWPFLRDGSDVELMPCTSHELDVGDVVLIKTGAGLLLHRIVGREGGGFRTKGDARRRDDGVIPRGRILGRLPRRRRGVLIAAMSRRFGWAIWLSANMYRQFFDRAHGPP